MLANHGHVRLNHSCREALRAPPALPVQGHSDAERVPAAQADVVQMGVRNSQLSAQACDQLSSLDKADDRHSGTLNSTQKSCSRNSAVNPSPRESKSSIVL